MFYRRKIILALMQQLGGEVAKLRLQKLLFLYCQKKQAPEYDFIPYKFGCYSHSVKADLNTMVKKGFLLENEHGFIKADQVNYLSSLKPPDKALLQDTISLYGKMGNQDLVRHTYVNFPFYAINSTIAKDVLSDVQLVRIENARSKSSGITLFTIGYEGISLRNTCKS